MNRFTYARRDADNPRWKVFQQGERPVALCETYEQAKQLADDLNELAQLRVLLAVASNTLAMSQACAILDLTEVQIKHRTASCLAKGFK